MAYLGRIAPIFNGCDGMNGTANLTQVKYNEVIDAQNITFEYGPFQKEGGTLAYNATPITGNPAILAGFDWWPDLVTQRAIVYGSDGKLYRDTGAGTFGTTVATGLATSNIIPVFVSAGKEAAAVNRKLFLMNGHDAVKYIDGDGVVLTALTNAAADWTGTNWPTCGAVHVGHLWLAGNANQPHTLYYSTLTNHADFTGAGSGIFQVFPGEGRNIAAVASYKGLLIVWKFPRGVYIINTTDPNSANWTSTRVTDATGAASPNGWTLIDNDLIWMDAVGNIQQLSTTLNFGFLEGTNVSQGANFRNWIDTNLNLSQIQFVHAVYYPLKRRAMFAVAGAGSTVQNIRLVVDYMHLDKPRFRYSNMDITESLWMRLDSNLLARPASGDTNGTMWLRDQASKSLGAAGAYNSQVQIPHLDMSHVDPSLAPKRKNGQFLELVVEPTGQWNVNATIIWDGVVKQVIPFNLGITGATLGSFTLGTDKLAGLAVAASRRRIVGGGRRFSLILSNNQAGQDFSISSGYLSFIEGTEKI